MKKTFKYILPVIALFLLGCDSDDDGFYNTKYVQAADLMHIVNPSATYAVNDVITIHAEVPRLLDEPGQTTLLDVVETTKAETFDFSYFLEKKNTAGEWELYDITNNYVEGHPDDAYVDMFVQGFLFYNEGAELYEYEAGVRLTETGDYRLNFSNNTNDYNKVFLRSNSVDNNIILNIFSTSDNLDSSGMFLFTVN